MIGVLASIFFSLPFVQTRIARYATETINSEYGTNINIDKVRFSPFSMGVDVKSIYIEDYKKDTLIYVKELTTSVMSIRNVVNGTLDFGDIDADQLYFNMKTYAGEEDTNLDVFVDKLDDGKPKDPDTPPFFMSSPNITIIDGRYKLSDENRESATILNLSQIEINAYDFQILGPEVSFDVEQLSLASKKGLRIAELRTDFKYTREQMRFDELAIKTQESQLNGGLVFDYNREDFADFLNKVKLTAEFKESVLAFNEVNPYFDEFGTDKTALFSTKAEGLFNDLIFKDLILSTDNTGIRGDFEFKNLFQQAAPLVDESRNRQSYL